jgi:uroporphyrinogen decarboxylase
MGELTGKKRISAAFKKTFSDQEPELDRVPAYMFTGSCNAQLVGASIGELLEKGKVFAKAQAAAYERYKPDIMLMMWDLNLEGQAMGNELRFPTDSMTVVTKAAIGDDKGKLSSLEVPDPHKDGRLPEYIDACVETKKVVTTSPVSGVIAGPWTIAMEIRGASNLMVDSLKDPDYVHEVMALCTQTSIRFTEALSEIGVGIGYSEAPASCDLISPDMYRKFVFPYHKQIVDHFKANKIGVGLHVCGNANGILEDRVKAGVSNLSVDSGRGCPWQGGSDWQRAHEHLPGRQQGCDEGSRSGVSGKGPEGQRLHPGLWLRSARHRTAGKDRLVHGARGRSRLL